MTRPFCVFRRCLKPQGALKRKLPGAPGEEVDAAPRYPRN